jgi:hypothetical protein
MEPAVRFRRRWRVRPIVAWFDMWIGVFVDQAKHRVYVLPIPCVGVIIEWADHE